MRRLFDLAGVDYLQWRALMRAYRIIDLAPLRGEYGSREALKAAAGLAFTIVAFTLMGSGAALIILLAPDALLGAVVMTTTTMWVAGMTLLFRVASIVLPDDYLMIGHRPICSRTYFAVRLGSVVMDALEVAAMSGWMPVLAFLARPHGSWRDAVGAVIAIAGSALTIAFAIVVLSAGLLRVVRPASFRRALQYGQMISGLGLTAAYMIVWTVFAERGRQAIASAVDFTFPRSTAMLLLPGTWFGSYVQVAGGHAGRFESVAAIVSIGVLLLLGTLLRGKLSTDYAVKVAQLSTDVPAPVAADARGASWLRGEQRAVALLMLGQFRGDLTVQTTVLMSLVMNAVILGLGRGLIGLPLDPFVTSRIDFPQFVAFLVPHNVLHSLAASNEAEASWPFFTSPSRRAELVMASRDVVAACLLGPMVVLLGALYLYSFGHVGHALLHLTATALIAYIVLQIGAIAAPAVPFSRPTTKRRPGGAWPAMLGFLGVLAGVSISAFFSSVIYPSLIATIVGLIALFGASRGLNHVTRWRVTENSDVVTYAG